MNQPNAMDAMLSAVQAADSVLLLCHIFPDGDTLGSALALWHRLRRMGKRARVLLDGAVPDYLDFLPGVGAVEDARAPWDDRALAVAVDVSAADRMGVFAPRFLAAALSCALDHHATNPGFAGVNVVDGHAPATALLVHDLLARLGQPLSQEEAVCLYTGLSTDTGNFIYESTDARSFEMMADLMRAGLPLAKYARLLFRQKQEPFVRVLAQVLPTLRLSDDGRVALLTLSNDMLARAGALPMHTEGVVDYAIDLKGVKAACFARETPDGRVKLSLRSLPPYRVDELAQSMGGGGHSLAAGVVMDGPLAEAAQTVWRALARLVQC